MENSKVLSIVLQTIMFLFLSERSSNSKRSIEGEKIKPTVLKSEFHLFSQICKMERSKIDQRILLAGTFYLGCMWTKTLCLGENCSETEANQ